MLFLLSFDTMRYPPRDSNPDWMRSERIASTEVGLEGYERWVRGSNPHSPKAITVFETDKHAGLATHQAEGPGVEPGQPCDWAG